MDQIYKTIGKSVLSKNNDITVLKISENELEDLIHGLRVVHIKVSADDRLKLTIDFNSGNIETYVEPRGDYNFTIEF